MSGTQARVRAALQLRKFDEAEHLARSALLDEPADATLLVLLADAMIGRRLRGVGELREVQRLARSAGASAPTDPQVLLMSASVLGRTGDRKAATEFAGQAVALAPDDPGAHGMLAQELLDLAVVDRLWAHRATLARAERHADIAMRLAPNDPFGFLVGAQIRSAAKDAPGCRRLAEEALRRQPDHPTGRLLLGMAAELDRDPRTASAHYLAAGRLDPRSDHAIQRLRNLRLEGPLRWLAVVSIPQILRGILTVSGATDSVAWSVFVVAAVIMLWLFAVRPRVHARRQMTYEAKQVLEVDRQIRRSSRHRP